MRVVTMNIGLVLVLVHCVSGGATWHNLPQSGVHELSPLPQPVHDDTLCEQWATNFRMKWFASSVSSNAAYLAKLDRSHDWRDMYDQMMMDCRDCMLHQSNKRHCNFQRCQNDRAVYVGHECTCAKHWTGSRCDIAICVKGWRNSLNRTQCQCQRHWSGDTCDVCQASLLLCHPGNLIRLLTSSVFCLLLLGCMSMVCAACLRCTDLCCCPVTDTNPSSVQDQASYIDHLDQANYYGDDPNQYLHPDSYNNEWVRLHKDQTLNGTHNFPINL